MESIVIFGAGIAGLSAAHELIQLGYTVSVYDSHLQYLSPLGWEHINLTW
jgi:uncharacterized protein with NAD-binding domain and iron-sulfur cluster